MNPRSKGICALAVAAAALLLAGPAAAASFSVTPAAAELYSTSKISVPLQFTIGFADASCGDGVEQAFAVTIPQWYESPLPSDINAFVQADENTLRYVGCTRGTTNPRIVSCNDYVDGNKLVELDKLTILLNARTSALEGNPVRTEIWNATILCDPAYAPIRTELTDELEVMSPVVSITSPGPDSIVSGTVDFIAEEANGIPHYVRFKLTQTAPHVPEMSDAGRAEGWSAEFDTTTIQNGVVLLKAYACDYALNCAEAVTRRFEVFNPDTQPETDTQKPAISGNSPLEALEGDMPTIQAILSDNNAINPETIEFYLDGTEVDCHFNAETGVVSYTPETPLSAGDHIVGLGVRDFSGNTAVLSWEIHTTAEPPTQPPVPQANRPPDIVSIIAMPQSPAAGEQVVFTADIIDENTDALLYTWAFGDGTLSHEHSPSHAYELAEGVASHTFSVSLSAADGEYIATYILDLIVRRAPAAPPTGPPSTPPAPQPGEQPAGQPIPIQVAMAIVFIVAVIMLYLANHPPTALESRLSDYRRKRFERPESRRRQALSTEERETRLGFQKLFIDAHKRPAALEHELKCRLSKAEREQIRRLVFLLRGQKARYSRAEMVKSILGQGYSERVAEKVVGLVYRLEPDKAK